MTLYLDKLLNSRSERLEHALKHELESLPPCTLPLQAGITRCGIVDDSDITVSIIAFKQDEHAIQARIGVFFTEIVAGCVCGEEPVPENAYCEMLLDIEAATGRARIEVLPG